LSNNEKLILLGVARSGASLLPQSFLADAEWSGNSSKNIDELAGFELSENDYSSHRWVENNEKYSKAIEDYYSGEKNLIDWTPRISLRAGLVSEVLPEAKFILMARRPLEVISSLMNAWRSGRFVSVEDLPGWWGEKWSFSLVPGWQEVIGSPLAQVCAMQWAEITNALLDDLEKIDKDRVQVCVFDEFLDDPKKEIEKICKEFNVPWSGELAEDLPPTPSVVSRPESNAWKKNASEIFAVFPSIQTTIDRYLKYLADAKPGFKWAELDESEDEETTKKSIVKSAGTPYSSSQTTSVVELLKQAQVSLVISTYKSGHVIVARSEEDTLNTEFTNVNRPMGIAVAGSRLAIGSADAILTFTYSADVAKKAPSAKPADLAYLPRSITFTGDIAIHDMGYGKDGVLYFINTKFSCLAKQDINYSFEPIWKPQWITNLAAEDRCHLNGLAMVDGVAKYVTALSQTDTPNGWREHKGSGGVIVDVTNDRIVAKDLSMPHSPRWYDNKLWVLESGKGTLAWVNIESGEVNTVATLPGFTRGLSFIGPYALVGLSQVRESVFTQLPITEQSAERNCGVWVVDTRNGEIVGYLKFDGVVQELFDVQVLPGKWPVIVDAGPLTQNAFVLSDEGLKQVQK
jgi:uncharacterized protein (TIGR03032 family)